MAKLSAESLFIRALEQPAGRLRAEFLDRQCSDDSKLRHEVDSLLEAHENAGDFLRTKTRPGAPNSGSPNTTSTVASPSHAATQATRCLESLSRGDATGAARELGRTTPEEHAEARERIQAALEIRTIARSLTARREPPATNEPDESAIRLPGFRLGARIGAGALGTVYAAHDEKLDRAVAIKILRGSRGNEAIRKRLIDEARKAAALDDPGIVTIFDVLETTDPPAIVMERVEGYPVDRFAANLGFEQKAAILRDIARSLAVAHARGVVHRDLKPDNVLVGPSLRPRLLDFGLALSLEEARGWDRGFEGTPLYASPEQILGRPLTTAADVFSLGSLMFKVLTGHPPFRGASVPEVLEAIATTAPPFLRDVAVGVPEDLQAIVLACLAWHPSDRPDADTVDVELGRYLAGEPVRLKPRLYDDLLRRRVSEYATETEGWEAQGIISREERDQLQVLHRRLLADEDHWIIDARRLTSAQTMLYTSTWIVVVATVLLVWLARDDLPAPWRWVAPAASTIALLGIGIAAERRREALAAASFLAAAALAVVPAALAVLKELGWLATATPGMGQVFGEAFTNQQFFAASFGAAAISTIALARLRMTGFAWTTAALGTTAYLAWTTTLGWLDWPLHRQALWCLPLVGSEGIALAFERQARVRWSIPFHLLALLALVGALDAIAQDGPTFALLGWTNDGYLTPNRSRELSFALNGLLFLALMSVAERSRSLDLRRIARALEILSLLHTQTALFQNANARHDPRWSGIDVALHLTAATLFLALGAWRGRWRMLVGALLGLALGSYLLVDLGLVHRGIFVLSLGGSGIVAATLTFIYLSRIPRVSSRKSQARPKVQ